MPIYLSILSASVSAQPFAHPVPRMAKTFDNISEASATNYLFIFAQRTLALQSEAPTPPPLNALGLPCEAMCRLWAQLYPTKAAAHQCLSLYLKSIGAPAGTAAAGTAEEKTAEKKEAEAAAYDLAPLAKQITEYILDHQDDAAQEDRWRTTMKRDIKQSFRTQHKKINEVQTVVQVMQQRFDGVHTKMDEAIQLVKDLAKEPNTKH